MNNSIFRKVSLDRLSSPEELDQLITVTSPRAWIALLGFGCILVTGLIWGIAGSIPTKTSGMGMITASEGVANIIHGVPGKITDVRVKVGDYVKKGEVVARIEQSDLVDEIINSKKELELVEAFNIDRLDEDKSELSSNLNDLYDIARRIKQASASLQANASFNKEQVSLSVNQAEIVLKQAQMDAAIAEKNAERQKILYEAGAISRKDLEDAEYRLDQTKVQVENAVQGLKKAQGKVNDSDAKLNVEYLKSQLETAKEVKISELTDKLNKDVTKLNSYSTIVSQVDGRILEVNIKKGDIIQGGAPVASLIRDGQTMNNLEVVLYVSAEEGKKVIPGMEAQISPTIVKKEDYGFMLGKVISVSEYPTSVQSLVQTLGNQELATKFSGGSAPIEVRVNLILDSSTFSGFKWSTAKGPSMKIDSGNICVGTIIIDDRKPIQMVIPYLKKKLNLN